MGVHNQQRRAVKAKERRRRRAPRPPAGSAFGPSPTPERTLYDGAERRRLLGEQIAADLSDAVTSLADLAPHRAEASIQRLLVQSVEPRAAALIHRQLRELLIAPIGLAWSRGWRPIDLHSYVGRELDTGAQAIAGDAMAAQLATYAVPTLAPSWPDQLRTIDATCWWPPQSDFVTERSRADGFEPTLRKVLDVAVLVTMLPTIERIDSLPGTARPGRTPSTPAGVDPRILERVRRMLAQAESTPYEAEADTFTAAAQSLMTRHSLDLAMLSASADRHTDEAKPTRVWVERPYEQEKVRLLQVVAETNRCRTVWSVGLGFATVVGHAADLAAVETIFTSLLLQATRAMLGEGSQFTRDGTSRTRSFRRSFLTAYAVRIGDRLREATDAATESAVAGTDFDASTSADGSSRALVRVLAERSAHVDALVDELFPTLVHKKSRMPTDGYGWAAGQRAADAANLSGSAAPLEGTGTAS
ncbi:MAG TPA: DUF2786 domain-containing protein [Flexivirga sp.]|uniref:DUF2786 domain-containing protein n=1 Tax=Flexivirga sp. TaxID=1962927 RepID=UPI002D07F36F|nr:DUF2786 domain-containing protein [Flexivirga sp.]HWC24539.1 DUF2786 domain-containing protein [Flexivirga sp.]